MKFDDTPICFSFSSSLFPSFSSSLLHFNRFIGCMRSFIWNYCFKKILGIMIWYLTLFKHSVTIITVHLSHCWKIYMIPFLSHKYLLITNNTGIFILFSFSHFVMETAFHRFSQPNVPGFYDKYYNNKNLKFNNILLFFIRHFRDYYYF